MKSSVVAVELPPGTEVITFPKRSGLFSIYDAIISFVIWHYCFWGIVAFTFFWIFVYVTGTSVTVGWIVVALYWMQVGVWKPQYDLGITWYSLVLHNPLIDASFHYLGATFIREGPAPDPNRKVMLAMAPHGLLGVCRSGTAGSVWGRLFPQVKVRWGSFAAAYYMPGIREFSLLVGAVDAGKKTLTKIVKSGEGIALLPGGIQEMLATDGESKITDVKLVGRYGFAKLACDHDMLLLPCFCFGEKWAHCRVLLPFWQIMHKCRMAGTIMLGRWYTLLPINTRQFGWVFAQPIETRGKTVEQVHEEYIQALTDVFNRHKKMFGYGDEENLKVSGVIQHESGPK